MDHNATYDLLIRYIDGEATAEEAVVMEELVHTDAYWKKEFEILNSLNQQIPAVLDYTVTAQTDANWEALKSQIELPAPGQTYKLWPSLARYAAAASVIFLAGWFLFKPAPDSYRDEFSSFDKGKTYTTGIKEISTIKLDDGSKIILNENSSLTLDKDYNKTNRLIELSGEAYFEVAPNTAKPFIAKTKNTFTSVLGTSFEIEANDKNKVSVSLFEGKVQFSSGKEKVILTPGEKLSYSSTDKTIKKAELMFVIAIINQHQICQNHCCYCFQNNRYP